MPFQLRPYFPPVFSTPALENAPDAVFRPAPRDGVAPENFHAMSIFPEYFKIAGQWHLARESRMDCVAVWDRGRIDVREFRRLRQGDLVAAGTAAQNGKKVLVIEKMEKAGRKIRITGKGRCNLTNARPPEEFAEQVRTNADFFATAFAEFNNRATIRFFERRGLKLDFERGDRVFPRSGKAWDVANTLEEWCRDNGVEFWFTLDCSRKA